MCVSIVNQMYADNWRPDYIVGITRGGNIPATIISNMTGIRCEALKVSLRDDNSQSESNAWMAEDALGNPHSDTDENKKQILIVDDINDTGATFNWIMQDWDINDTQDNVRFATLTENLSSDFSKVSYSCHEVNKAEEDVWLVYPWENIGEYNDI
jgi:hypoxanthine phosphoribosyltransferase